MSLLKTGIHCLDFKMLYTNYFFFFFNSIKDHFLNKTELVRIKSSITTITLDLRGLPQNFKFFSYILNKRLFQQVEKKNYSTLTTVSGIRNFMINKIQMLLVSYFSQFESYQLLNLYLTMLLLLLSCFSLVRLYATPQMAAHQDPPSLGFSRQEHWSGLPFPSPMHESEK